MILHILLLAVTLGVFGLVGKCLIDTHGGDNEQLRKLVHILHGVGLAALAFVVPLSYVIAVEVVFFMSMIAARYLASHFTKIPWISYMNRMYSVGRLSFGEFFYPISAILTLLIADTKWEFAAAILVLGIADTAAALIGKKYGKSSSYAVFGQRKSVIGSIAFFVATVAILVFYAAFSGVGFGAMNIVLLLVCAVMVTIAENLGVYGSDNLLIPLVVVVLLNQLA